MGELGKPLRQKQRVVVRCAIAIVLSFVHLGAALDIKMPDGQRTGGFPCSMTPRLRLLFQLWQRLLHAADRGPGILALSRQPLHEVFHGELVSGFQATQFVPVDRH